MKEHIGNFLKTRLNDLKMNRQDLVYSTGISETNISKHFNGARDISNKDLVKYAKSLKFDYQDMKDTYNIAKIEVCKDGTLANILKIGAGLGIGFLAFKGVEKIIDENCKHISK